MAAWKTVNGKHPSIQLNSEFQPTMSPQWPKTKELEEVRVWNQESVLSPQYFVRKLCYSVCFSRSTITGLRLIIYQELSWMVIAHDGTTEHISNLIQYSDLHQVIQHFISSSVCHGAGLIWWILNLYQKSSGRRTKNPKGEKQLSPLPSSFWSTILSPQYIYIYILFSLVWIFLFINNSYIKW